MFHTFQDVHSNSLRGRKYWPPSKEDDFLSFFFILVISKNNVTKKMLEPLKFTLLSRISHIVVPFLGYN